MMARGETLDPQSIASMRAALTDMYGLSGSPVEQYFAFWGRLLRGDLGPSLANFPTPVSEMIGQAMPYTLSLLITAVIISWIFGNLFGALSSYYPKNKVLSVIEVLGQAVRPIPYYIVAIVLLVVFAFFIPIFPFSGAYPIGTRPNWSLEFVLDLPPACRAPGSHPGAGRVWRLVYRHEITHLQHHLRGLCGLCRNRRDERKQDPAQLHHAQRLAATAHRAGHVAWNGL